MRLAETEELPRMTYGSGNLPASGCGQLEFRHVTVTGTDADGVESTLRAVTARIGTQLALLQHGIGVRGRVRAGTLSFAQQATLSISQTARPFVVLGALLLVFCLGVPIVVDWLVTRRQLRNRSSYRASGGSKRLFRLREFSQQRGGGGWGCGRHCRSRRPRDRGAS